MKRVERIGVVGAGLMGREIALVFALAGFEVVLSGPALRTTVASSISESVRRRAQSLPSGYRPAVCTKNMNSSALERISTTIDMADFSRSMILWLRPCSSGKMSRPAFFEASRRTL